MTVRITVSLPDALVERVNKVVADGQAASVSAYVAEALQIALGRVRAVDLVDEWLAEMRPLTPEEQQWVDDAMAAVERAGRAED